MRILSKIGIRTQAVCLALGIVVAMNITWWINGRGVSMDPALLPLATPAPPWTLADSQGRVYKLDNTKGSIVWLEFFATWCPHCRAMVDELNQVARQPGVLVLAVNASEWGMGNTLGDRPRVTQADLTRFADVTGATYPLLWDLGQGQAGAYKVHQYPTLYLLDRRGIIRAAYSRELPPKLVGSITNRALLELWPTP